MRNIEEEMEVTGWSVSARQMGVRAQRDANNILLTVICSHAQRQVQPRSIAHEFVTTRICLVRKTGTSACRRCVVTLASSAVTQGSANSAQQTSNLFFFFFKQKTAYEMIW